MSKFLSSLLNKAMFKTPPRSAFPQSNEVKVSYRVGKRIPVQRWILNPGDTLDVNLQQLTRFMPLAAPIMHNFRVDLHAIEIPDRLSIPISSPAGSIDGGFENFHNLDVSDVDRPVMPQFTFSQYVKWLVDYGVNPNGTLLDALGYPTFRDLYRKLTASNVSRWLDATFTYKSSTTIDGAFGNETGASISISYQGITINVNFYGFQRWLYATADSTLSLAGLFSACGIVPVADNSYPRSTFNDYLLNLLGWTSEHAVKLWLDYVFVKALDAFLTAANTGTAVTDTTVFSEKPLYDFWTAVYDWFINTNISKPSSKRAFLSDHGLVMNGSVSGTYGFLPAVNSVVAHRLVDYPDALWSDDYFTSAFDVPANGGSVSTVNLTTIQQFREASAVDKLRILLQYTGKRYIDQILGIFGIHSSNELLDRCKVVGVAHFNLQVSDIDQQSKSDIDSSLGTLAGKAIGIGENGSFIHHTAEEHSTVMVFATVRPVADYDQVLPADLLKISPYDYCIPQLAKVGEQQIRNIELYPSITSGSNVFGFTRRYAEYMYTPNRIIGEFGTSLDYWHAAREFDSLPALNEEFISVNSDLDNLDRIFAVRGGDNVMSYFYFDTVISRPLPKYVSYGF